MNTFGVELGKWQMKGRGKGRQGLRVCHFEGECSNVTVVVVSAAEELLQK